MTASQAGKRGLDRADIEDGLRRLGVAMGMALEVHSSLRSFGWVDGGAAVVVDALMRAVGPDGALVMSAYPLSKPLPLTPRDRTRGILAKVRIHDQGYDGPTGMGAIADEFRRRPGTVLGRGVHRVCAWGRDAQRYAEGYQHLLEADGSALLLGVGIRYCSGLHQAEAAGIPPEIAARFRVPDDLRREYPEDVHLACGGDPSDAWERVREEADRQGMYGGAASGRASACSSASGRSWRSTSGPSVPIPSPSSESRGPGRSRRTTRDQLVAALAAYRRPGTPTFARHFVRLLAVLE